MIRSKTLLKLILIGLLISGSAFADTNNANASSAPLIQGPWMTGPLLAPSGNTIPKNNLNVETYLFGTDNNGVYNSRSKVVPVPATTIISPSVILSYGLTNWMDITLSVPYDFKERQGRSFNGIGDTGIVFGFQALRSKAGSWLPNLRLTIEELFPSGRYENLDPNNLGVDAIGAGSYQTSFGADFQQLHQFENEKYLSTRLALLYTIPNSTHVNGFNSYGGGFDTNGTVDPGNVFSTDLGFEYTLTQNWVPAFDVLYTNSRSTHFNGVTGVATTGLPAINTVPSGDQISLAPALEYNFSAKLGIIGGVWFSVYGKNSEKFTSSVVALNYYF